MSELSSVQRFGAHMSIAGGLENAFSAGKAVGCDCLQIFVKNQRQWSAPPLSEAQIQRYRLAQQETGLTPVIAHATYLINLASPDESLRGRSVNALADELSRCEALEVSGLVLHPGAHMGAGEDLGIDRIIASVNEVLSRAGGYRVRLLLETTAGQGSSIGHRIEHLGRILAEVSASERLGVCLDTCHLLAAGYDLTTLEGYEHTLDEIVRHVGLDRVQCIHVNDSKRECGSKVDRHEHIGKGCMTVAAFARLLNDSRLAGVPRILETPKGQDGRGTDFDVINLKRLRKLLTTTT